MASGSGQESLPATLEIRVSQSSAEQLRPAWVDDKEASECANCGLLFSLFRWKHHCRQCGYVFCNSCSNKKIPLPHLGYPKPVRICTECIQLAYLVSCTSSPNPTVAVHGVEGLASLSAQQDYHHRLLRAAAFPALATVLSPGGDDETLVHASGALANLSRPSHLVGHVLSAGALPKLLALLPPALSSGPHTLAHNILGAALNLSEYPPARTALVDAGLVPLLVDALFVHDLDLACLAMRTACALAADVSSARAFIQDDTGLTFKRILSTISGVTPKALLKLLAKFVAHVSLVDNALKVRMLELGTLAPLQGLAVTKSKSVVTLAVCAMANLASADDNREFVGSSTGLRILWKLLLKGKSLDIQRHTSRALANVALNDQVKDRMLRMSSQLIPRLLQVLALASHPDVVTNALRLVANLSISPLGAVLLTQSGPQPLLAQYSSSENDAIRSCANFALAQLVTETNPDDPDIRAALATAASIRSSSARSTSSTSPTLSCMSTPPTPTPAAHITSTPPSSSSSRPPPLPILYTDRADLPGPTLSSPDSVASSVTSMSSRSSATSASTYFSDSDPFALPRTSSSHSRRSKRTRHRAPGYVGVTLSQTPKSSTPGSSSSGKVQGSFYAPPSSNPLSSSSPRFYPFPTMDSDTTMPFPLSAPSSEEMVSTLDLPVGPPPSASSTTTTVVGGGVSSLDSPPSSPLPTGPPSLPGLPTGLPPRP